ncbi:unnamed protein product, partial [Brassica oleracea]
AAPAPADGNRPTDPTLPMVHDILSKTQISQSGEDKLRINQRSGRKGQFKRHGKTPKAQVKCDTRVSCTWRESLCSGDGGNSIQCSKTVEGSCDRIIDGWWNPCRCFV